MSEHRGELLPDAVGGQPGWDGGWEAQRRAQVAGWLTTTPAQRLAWLEEAIAFAYRAGALPRSQRPED